MGKRIVSECCIKIEDKYFFVGRDLGIIYSVSEKTGEAKIEGKLPEKNNGHYRLCGEILRFEDKVIFVPLNNEELQIYDCTEKRWISIDIEQVKDCSADRFFSAVIHRRKLIMLGANYPAIMIVDMDSYETRYIKEIYEPLKELKKEKNDAYIRNNICCIGDKIYAASCISNEVLVFDIEKYTWSWHRVGDDDNRYSGIAYDGEAFWIAPRRKGSVIKWIAESDEITEYQLIDMKYDKLYFTGVIYDGENLIFPGMENRQTLIVNPKEADIKKSCIIIDENFTFFKVMDNKYCGVTSDGRFIEYDKHGVKLKEYDINIDGKEMLDFYNGNVVVEEGVTMQLGDLIEYLQ